MPFCFSSTTRAPAWRRRFRRCGRWNCCSHDHVAVAPAPLDLGEHGFRRICRSGLPRYKRGSRKRASSGPLGATWMLVRIDQLEATGNLPPPLLRRIGFDMDGFWSGLATLAIWTLAGRPGVRRLDPAVRHAPLAAAPLGTLEEPAAAPIFPLALGAPPLPRPEDARQPDTGLAQSDLSRAAGIPDGNRPARWCSC